VLQIIVLLCKKNPFTFFIKILIMSQATLEFVRKSDNGDEQVVFIIDFFPSSDYFRIANGHYKLLLTVNEIQIKNEDGIDVILPKDQFVDNAALKRAECCGSGTVCRLAHEHVVNECKYLHLIH